MWDDGSENRYIIPLHPKDGDHKLTCYAVDEAGNVGDERTMNFQTDSIDPTAFFTTTPAYAFTGKEVVFDASNSTDNIEVAAYYFDFGDGDTEDLRGDTVINHVYITQGTFHVTLTVTDKAGRKNSYTKDVFVEKPPKRDQGISGLLENPFILMLLLLVIVAIIGVGVARYRRKQQLLKAVAAYEAYMAQRTQAVARANRAKAKGKKGRAKGPAGATRPQSPKR